MTLGVVVFARDDTWGQDGLGGGVRQIGNEDWVAKVDIFMDETGLGIGEIVVVSITPRFSSALQLN